jgi:hypothetical protein
MQHSRMATSKRRALLLLLQVVVQLVGAVLLLLLQVLGQIGVATVHGSAKVHVNADKRE